MCPPLTLSRPRLHTCTRAWRRTASALGRTYGHTCSPLYVCCCHCLFVSARMRSQSHLRCLCRPCLRQWDETALRIKASRLIGSQNLTARYAGWKGTRAAVELEYGRNKRIGERTGCWKSGVLVEDHLGTVAKALAEEAGEAAAGPAAAGGDQAAPAPKKARGARS